MKRIVHLFLLALMIASSVATAEAKSKPRKSQKKATQEQTLTAISPEAQEGPHIKPESKQVDPGGVLVSKPGPVPAGPPIQQQLTRAASRRFDLRSLPRTRPIEHERAELPEPIPNPLAVEGTIVPEPSKPAVPRPLAPAPAPNNVFEGLDRFNWGAG